VAITERTHEVPESKKPSESLKELGPIIGSATRKSSLLIVSESPLFTRANTAK